MPSLASLDGASRFQQRAGAEHRFDGTLAIARRKVDRTDALLEHCYRIAVTARIEEDGLRDSATLTMFRARQA